MTMPVTLKNRNGTFYAMGTLTLPGGGKVVVRQSTGFTSGQRAFAEKRLSEIIREHLEAGVAGRSHEIEVGRAVERYLGNRPGISKTDRAILARFERRFRGVKCSQLDKVRVLEWAEAKVVTDAPGASTVRRRISTVQACLNYARDCGYTVAEMRIRKPREAEARDRWLDEAMRDRLLGAFEEGLYRDIATFLFYTGARLNECLQLAAGEVTPEGVVFASRKGAGGRVRKRVVPLHPGLRRLVEARARGLERHELVFGYERECKKGKKVDDNVFRQKWHEACGKVGLVDFLPHDARHTFATLLAKTGEVDLHELAQLLGHANVQMTMRYRHLLPRRQVAGIDALGVICTGDAQGVVTQRKLVTEWVALSVG